jgi:hypothetical protein
MKTRTPANNRRNLRRARAISRLEAKIASQGKLDAVRRLSPEKLAAAKLELENIKKIQIAKGGNL